MSHQHPAPHSAGRGPRAGDTAGIPRLPAAAPDTGRALFIIIVARGRTVLQTDESPPPIAQWECSAGMRPTCFPSSDFTEFSRNAHCTFSRADPQSPSDQTTHGIYLFVPTAYSATGYVFSETVEDSEEDNDYDPDEDDDEDSDDS